VSRPNNGAIEVPVHVEALIFDCDGILTDTMPLHYRARRGWWRPTCDLTYHSKRISS
jgi:beta-phosphoglucomutase-like phosphatase (HAD superfamily)